MEISLLKAEIADCQLIHQLQIESFKDLLDKYQDSDTNPGAEPLKKIEQRMAQCFTDYYLICLNDKKIGAIRISKLESDIFKISPIFILPEYRGKGYARAALTKIEASYPRAKKWELATIKQETKLCRFYESLGYVTTGRETLIQENMTIIGYVKICKNEAMFLDNCENPL